MTLRGVPVDDRPFNNLLRRLTDQDYELLAPHLERVELPANAVLYHPGEDVRTVYFPARQARRRLWFRSRMVATFKPFWSAMRARLAAL